MNWLESCFVSHLESALLQLWVMSSLESAFALSLSLVEASFESYRPWNLLLLYLWVLSRPALSLVVLGICFCFILESCRGHLWVLSSLESAFALSLSLVEAIFESCRPWNLLWRVSLGLVRFWVSFHFGILSVMSCWSWSAGGGICFWVLSANIRIFWIFFFYISKGSWPPIGSVEAEDDTKLVCDLWNCFCIFLNF